VPERVLNGMLNPLRAAAVLAKQELIDETSFAAFIGHLLGFGVGHRAGPLHRAADPLIDLPGSLAGHGLNVRTNAI
jgi:hypothetical protein